MKDQEQILNIASSFASILKIKGHDGKFEDLDALYNELDNFLNTVSIRLDHETLDEVRLELQCKYQISNKDPGHSIQFDYDQPKWYSEALQEGRIEDKFWSRYKHYLLTEKNFSIPIVEDLDKKTLKEELLNFLADPCSTEPCLKRGLIIGDVQSGKTSTYIGLISKAADAGYRVFIILAGMIESLRAQTQQRIEEGFIGFDISEPGDNRVGVGKDNHQIMADSMTSRTTDFTGKHNEIAVSLKGKSAVVFVIKKNTSVLTKLYNWLYKLNRNPLTGKIDEPMLLIDDEADNASINTNDIKKGEDPTRINGLIRKLTNLFRISNYVAFTATPFANVFIDPLTDVEMYRHDLFPEDFIVALPTPENYVGASSIFHKDGKYHSQLIYIDDAGEKENDGFSFYYKHKKEWDGDLPDSLRTALYAFYIVNAIRDLSGDENKHRTMMVNITRFTAVQYRVRDKILELHKKALRAIRFNLTGNSDISLQDPILCDIHKVYSEQYSNCKYSWGQIADILYDSVEPITLKVINSSKNSDKLEYKDDDPVRTIAIGGLALSRGLTLEGLIISYFYRNTSTYDVLMQMGRWFGYRRGYETLFRIWISQQSAEWYSEISDATEQLKQDMDTMNRKRLKPKDFGIRVRNDSDRLEITARNKMRNSTVKYHTSSYYGGYIETPYLSANASVQRSNYESVRRMITALDKKGYAFDQLSSVKQKRILIRNVNIQQIITLLDSVDVTDFNKNFDTKQIVHFLKTADDKALEKWDVVFMEGTGSEADFGVFQTTKVLRTNCMIDEEGQRLAIGQKGRLGGTGDGKTGVSSNLLDSAKEQFRATYGNTDSSIGFSSDTWFRFISIYDRNPMLIIYPVEVKSTDTDIMKKRFSLFSEALGNIPVIGFGIGIPYNPDEQYIAKSRYKQNKQYSFFDTGYDEYDDDEEAQE